MYEFARANAHVLNHVACGTAIYAIKRFALNGATRNMNDVRYLGHRQRGRGVKLIVKWIHCILPV